MEKKSMIALLIFSFSMLFNQLIAQQTCNDAAIINKKGGWNKTGDANMKAGNQAQVISRIDRMQKLLQAAYPDPVGIEAKWYRSMVNSPLIKNGPDPYQLDAMFKIYYCMSEKEMVLGDETSTWFYIYANHFNWFMQYDRTFTVSKNPVYMLTKKVGEIRGYPVYEGIHNGTSNTGTRYSRAIIITRPGQSPYVPVTRKQYLTLYLKRYEMERSERMPLIEKTPVRSDAEEEALKQRTLKSIEKNTSPSKVENAKSLFLKTYVTDKQQKEINLKKLNKMYDDAMKPAQELLKNLGVEDAKLPAIIEGDYISGFKQFSTEETGGRMLLRLNPGYFNPKLPRHVPQFLIVYWRWEKHQPSEYFKQQLEANFNFDALKEMIDK